MFESLSDKLQKAFTGFKSKGHLTEDDINDGIREIRMALLEADVNYKVVKNFTRRVKERCLTAEVMDSLTPGQNVIKIVLDELTELLGGTTAELTFGSRIPGVVMLVGLQGSGKTTAAAKLAYRLGKQGHNPLLVACDVYRPAASDQLQTLGDEMGVRVYRGDGKDPVKIATEGVRDAIDNLRDVVIIDTAGRLHVDEEMMDEAVAIRDAVEPDQILMVVDAMTGQDVVNVAAAFAEQVDFDTFSKSDFRAVKIKNCEAVKKSDKLLKFTLDDGSGTDRVILSGVHHYYEPEELIGKTVVAIVNLPPRRMMGIDSCGMLISAVHKEHGEEKLHLMIIDDSVPAGAKLC